MSICLDIRWPVEVGRWWGIPWNWSCELPGRFWETNSGPLEEQSVLLTPELSLQPPEFLFTYLHVYGCSVSMYIYMPHVCLIPENRRRLLIPWDWS